MVGWDALTPCSNISILLYIEYNSEDLIMLTKWNQNNMLLSLRILAYIRFVFDDSEENSKTWSKLWRAILLDQIYFAHNIVIHLNHYGFNAKIKNIFIVNIQIICHLRLNLSEMVTQCDQNTWYSFHIDKHACFRAIHCLNKIELEQ